MNGIAPFSGGLPHVTDCAPLQRSATEAISLMAVSL